MSDSVDGLDPNTLMVDLDDGLLTSYLRGINIPYDPVMKRLLLALKPELAKHTLAQFLTRDLPDIVRSPLVKALIAGRRQGSTHTTEIATQCPHCASFFQLNLVTAASEGG